MKEKTKNILRDLGNIVGYGSTIGVIIVNGRILYKVYKHGVLRLVEPNKLILAIEGIFMGGIVTFLGYKLVKNIQNRYSLKK